MKGHIKRRRTSYSERGHRTREWNNRATRRDGLETPGRDTISAPEPEEDRNEQAAGPG